MSGSLKNSVASRTVQGSGSGLGANTLQLQFRLGFGVAGVE